MREPTHVTNVWKVPNHIAIVTDGLGGKLLDPDHPLLAVFPCGLLFHSHAACLQAIEAYLRATADYEPAAIVNKPWGPHFSDYEWQKKHGEPTYEWRVHRLSIAATAGGVEVDATLDVRILAKRSVPTFVEEEGVRTIAGRTTRLVPVEDWAPFRGNRVPGDCGPIDPDDPDKRVRRSWTIEPEADTIEWGDAP